MAHGLRFEDDAAQMSACMQLMNKFIEIGNQAPGNEIRFGHPCSWLMDRNKRGALPNAFGKYLNSDDYRVGQSFELRLNGAGLKLFANFEYQGWVFSIGGDQKEDYPVTVPLLREAIKQSPFAYRSSYQDKE